MSPLERLVDAVMVCTTCGATGMTCDCWKPTADPRLPAVIASSASQVAREVLDYIDTMYPGMWHGVPRTARHSVCQTIAARVRAVLRDLLLP